MPKNGVTPTKVACFRVPHQVAVTLSPRRFNEWLTVNLVDVANRLGLQGTRVSGIHTSKPDDDDLRHVQYYDFYGAPDRHMMPVPDGWFTTAGSGERREA